MKRVGIALACALLGVSSVRGADQVPPSPSAAAAAAAWNVTFASDVRYYSWESNRGYPTTIIPSAGKGSELYIPFALQLAGKPNNDFSVQLLMRGGWVHAQQGTPGGTASVDTFTDTVASGTVTYLGVRGFQPFVGLNVNMPTGRSVLSGTAAAARMDPDLVEIANFGEGWNVGPTVGANIPVSASLMLTGSVGYTWRGAYDRERSLLEPNPAIQALVSLDPGDVVSGTASIAYSAAPWSWKLTGMVSEESTTRENNIDIFRVGRRYVGTGTASYSWPEKFGQTTLTGSYAHTNRNDVKFAFLPALIREFMNSNSDLYRVDIQHLFAPAANLAIGPIASYLHRFQNGYDPGTLQLVPEIGRAHV